MMYDYVLYEESHQHLIKKIFTTLKDDLLKKIFSLN